MRFILPLVCAAFIIPGMTAEAREATVRYYVMGPLEPVEDLSRLEKQFSTLKRAGTDAVTIDFFWGLIEKSPGVYDWSYYKSIIGVARAAGIRIIPILSFHKAGGNVGDNVTIPLPQWVWTDPTMKYMGYNPRESDEAKRWVVNDEYISIWSPEAYPLYRRFMHSLAEAFASDRDVIEKVYIGTGPAGELRYPSYVFAAGWRYPNIGLLQAHSPRATQSFRAFVTGKYQTVEALNASWGLAFSSLQDPTIRPPMDGQTFFRGGMNSAYKNDFVNWYQGEQLRHLRTMIRMAHEELDPHLGRPLGVKLAGIHWRATDPEYPHAAEIAAGYYDYEPYIRVINEEKAEITFTCLELPDSDGSPNYSRPYELASKIVSLARAQNPYAHLSAENALSMGTDVSGYARARQRLDALRFNAFTLLRMGDIVDEEGKETPAMALYRTFITAPNPPQNLTILAHPPHHAHPIVDKIKRFLCENLFGSREPDYADEQWPPELFDFHPKKEEP